MTVKILHAADLHLDSPFEALPAAMAAQRRRETRQLLASIAETADRAGAQMVLLAGDLFDSAAAYSETAEELSSVFGRMSARVFVSPGNHDHCGPRSPYGYMRFPENVHVFKNPAPEAVELPELGCRVWGAGFNDIRSAPLLRGFHTGSSPFIELMVLHGDVGGGDYNPVTEAEIAASGLDYLALGHIHAFSGIRRAGDTFYAYPGCPEGRGFDETGEKGVITGEIGKGVAELSFLPLGGRQYRTVGIDMTGCTGGAAEYVLSRFPQGAERDICRVVLTGSCDGAPDAEAIAEALTGRCWFIQVRDRTRPRRNIWQGLGEDTLRGAFLARMRERYDGAEESGRQAIELAVRYGLAALENGEDDFQ